MKKGYIPSMTLYARVDGTNRAPYLCDTRPDCHHHFDASGTSNAMFDELAERSLMSPFAGTKHTYVLSIVKFLLFFKFVRNSPNEKH